MKAVAMRVDYDLRGNSTMLNRPWKARERRHHRPWHWHKLKPPAGLKFSGRYIRLCFRRRANNLRKKFSSARLRLPTGLKSALECRAFFNIPLQWACFIVALFYVVYGGLWLAYSLNYMYDLILYHKECPKLAIETDDRIADGELLKKCAEFHNLAEQSVDTDDMREGQALNLGSNFLFGLFTVNMGLILLCGSKTRNQYLVLTFLIGEIILHVVFYFMYFLFRAYGPVRVGTAAGESRAIVRGQPVVSWYGNPISGPWRIVWEWVLLWLVFAYFVQLCKEVESHEGEGGDSTISQIHPMHDVLKFLERNFDLKLSHLTGMKKSKTSAIAPAQI